MNSTSAIGLAFFSPSKETLAKTKDTFEIGNKLMLAMTANMRPSDKTPLTLFSLPRDQRLEEAGFDLERLKEAGVIQEQASSNFTSGKK